MAKQKTKSHIQLTGANALQIVQKFFPGVKRVDDADAGLEIAVTDKDDKMASKANHTGCAMAVAMKREFKLDGVIVSMGTAYTVKGDRAVRYSVPPRVSREVVSFDRGAIFAPGVYRLNRPCKSQRLGQHTGGPAPRHSYDPDTKRSRPHVLTAGVRGVLGAKHDIG